MQALKQIGGGFFLGVLSIGIVLGGFAVALAEGGMIEPAMPTHTPTAAYPTIYPTLPLLSATETRGAPDTPSATATHTETITPPPPPTSCLPPQGWQALLLQPYDTLDAIAQTYQISAAEIKTANCLVGNELSAGSFLYVPPLLVTATKIYCGAPAGWVTYFVKTGDTLYKISLLYRVSVSQLQIANCLGASTYIYVGQPLKVPNVPTSTASFTPILSATNTYTASPTLAVTDSTNTASPVATTETPTPLATATTMPSFTPENSATPIPPPTETISPTP